VKEPFYSQFCDNCKSEFDRMELGYNAHGLECTSRKCHFFQMVNWGLFILISPILLLILIPILIFFLILNFLESLGNNSRG